MNTPLRRSLQALAVCCLATAGLPASAAGTVQVSFVQPEMFSDAGTGIERERNLATLSSAIQRLGQQHLAEGDALDIQVLDVDMAGRSDPFALRGSGREIRLLTGQADWPRITLRYTLTRAGVATATEEVRLSDMNYLQDGRLRPSQSLESLAYERHMLDTWFDERFGPAQVSVR